MAALASEAAAGAVHTFTIGFEEEEYDESRYAGRWRRPSAAGTPASCSREPTFEEQLGDAFTAIDQPTFDGINTYFVSRAAREAGMTVALAGTGGDELFGGYRSFVEIPKMLRAGTLLRFGAADAAVRRAVDGGFSLGARVAGGMSWNLFQVAPPQTRWGKVADVAGAAHDLLSLYQVSYALFTRESQGALAADAVRAEQSASRTGCRKAWPRTGAGPSPASDVRHAVSMLELSSFLGERLLRDTDTASMAVALEVRVPLLDHVLAEVVAGIDPARRFTPPRRKQLLRDVALGGLDPALFDRPKRGFVLPIDTWARRRLRPQMEAVLGDEALAVRAGLSGPAVRTLWRSFSTDARACTGRGSGPSTCCWPGAASTGCRCRMWPLLRVLPGLGLPPPSKPPPLLRGRPRWESPLSWRDGPPTTAIRGRWPRASAAGGSSRSSA